MNNKNMYFYLNNKSAALHEDDAEFIRLELRASVVIEVVPQGSITLAEQQVPEDLFIIHNIQGIEDIEFFIAGKDEGILD